MELTKTPKLQAARDQHIIEKELKKVISRNSTQ